VKSTATLLSLLTVVFSAKAALACGAPFGVGVNVDPQQDIVVVHKSGVETYVFQPRFCGAAKDFGLILPVPAKLTEEPSLASPAAFTRVDAVSKPAIEDRTACLSKGPADGSVGASRAADAGTTVLSSGKVGFLDWVQLQADSETAFTDWLGANGYPYDSQASATFTYYVQKGWYFLAFRISAGAVDAGGATCNTLGPIKLSFPSTNPVVPSRMASARTKDTSGSLSYGSGFSWRIFGITTGDLQFGFTDGETASTRKLGYSGLLTAADEADLTGLGVAGDRLTRLTIFFPYASTDPDVGLSLVAGKDFREVQYNTTYIACNDGGVDASGSDSQPDARVAEPDLAVAIEDAGPVLADAQATTAPDAGSPRDAKSTNPADEGGKSGGCSLSDDSPKPGLWVLMLVGWLLVMTRRRRARAPR